MKYDVYKKANKSVGYRYRQVNKIDKENALAFNI